MSGSIGGVSTGMRSSAVNPGGGATPSQASSPVQSNVVFEKATPAILRAVKEHGDIQCGICYEEYEETDEVFVHVAHEAQGTSEKVYHAFHKSCLREWCKKKNVCPTCVRPFDCDELIPRINSISSLVKNLTGSSVNFDQLAIASGTTAFSYLYGALLGLLREVAKMRTSPPKIPMRGRGRDFTRQQVVKLSDVFQIFKKGGESLSMISAAIICVWIGRKLAKIVQEKQNTTQARPEIQEAKGALIGIPCGTFVGAFFIMATSAMASIMLKERSTTQILSLGVSAVAATTAAGALGLGLGVASTQIV